MIIAAAVLLILGLLAMFRGLRHSGAWMVIGIIMWFIGAFLFWSAVAENAGVG